MTRTDMIAAVFANALQTGKTVAEASALAESVNAIPEALLGIVGPALMGKAAPAPATTTRQDAAPAPQITHPLSVSGVPLTDAQITARLVRLSLLEDKETERKAKAATKCPIQPALFLNHGPALTADAFAGQTCEARGFQLAETTDETGKKHKTPGTAKSVGFWGQVRVRVAVTLPGTGVAQEVTLTAQVCATVVGSKEWSQEERNAWIETPKSPVDLYTLIGRGLDQGRKDGDLSTDAAPRTFDSGAVGYNLNGKGQCETVRRDLSTGRVTLQVGVNAFLPGSKALANG